MTRHKTITPERYEREKAEEPVEFSPPRLSFYQRYSKIGMILLLVVCSCFIAVAVPYLVNRFGFGLPLPSDYSNSGTCRINAGFKVDCLPDLPQSYVVSQAAQTDCRVRGCCYDNTTDTPCYHKLPSYQYSSKIEQFSPDLLSGALLSPSLFNPEKKSRLTYSISGGEQENHVIIDIRPEQTPEVAGEKISGDLSVTVGCPGSDESKDCEENKDIFTFDLKLQSNSLVRSHFGPLMVTEDLSEVSLYMAGPRIIMYGMEEFVWNRESHVTQFYFNHQSSVHLPLVVGMLPNTDWFLAVLDTNRPGEMVLSTGTDLRPVVTWRTMGGPLTLHILTADTLPALLRKQLEMKSEPVVSPPHHSLGYQLCRDTGQARWFKQDLEGMLGANIQFDGDCIDQQLVKDAFTLNEDSFLTSLTNQASLLMERNKFFSLPLVFQRLYDNVTGHRDGCIKEDSSSSSCYNGKLYDKRVMFPDMSSSEWMSAEFDKLRSKLEEYSLSAGVWYVDSAAPLDTETKPDCPGFPFVPRGVDLSSGLVCQTAWSSALQSSLLAQHSSYSRHLSRDLNTLAGSEYQFSGQYSYGSEETGGFLGSRVSASWAGLGQSLREVLMLGLAGQGMVSMPVCGTQQAEEEEEVELLCLRWAQLAAFMPSLRSWYSGSDNARMPYRLETLQYQEYIQWALERRYQLLPYMMTLQQDWVITGLPLVRPMFLHYSDSFMFGLWSQFMLGPDLVVAAVTSPEQEVVRVRLPPGSWYDFYSGIKYQSPGSATVLPVQARTYELPAFQRGGSVIIVYKALSLSAGQSGQNYLDEAELEVKVALECSGGPRQLQVCEATSSHAWVLDTGAARVNITVNTRDSWGELVVESEGETSKNLSLIMISGLYPSPGLTFTVETTGGQSVEATECGEADSSVCWTDQQDLVLLRNINFSLTALNRITWDADMSSSSSTTASTTTTTRTTNTTE